MRCLSSLVAIPVILCLGAGCATVTGSAEPAIREGKALVPNDSRSYKELRTVPPGQELVLALNVTLSNVSQSLIEIDRIEPIGGPDSSGPLQIVSVDLTAQGEQKVAPGTFLTYPPVETDPMDPSACRTQALEDVRGYQLDPSVSFDNEAAVVLRLRALKPGFAELLIARVFYKQDGQDFFQDLPYVIKVSIQEGARGYPRPFPFERPCITPAIEVLGTG